MGKGCNWRIIHPDMGARDLTLNHSIHGPGHEFPQHTHDDTEDVFIILEGGVSVRQGDVYSPISAGEAAFIPAREVHGTVNTTDAPARLISFQSPPDMALYRGERNKADSETPKPPAGHESGVQIITLARGGPVFGRKGNWRCVTSRQNGARYLRVHYIQVGPDEGFEHEPEDGETAYVVLSGLVSVTHNGAISRLQAEDVLFLQAGERVSLNIDEPTVLIRTQAMK